MRRKSAYTNLIKHFINILIFTAATSLYSCSPLYFHQLNKDHFYSIEEFNASDTLIFKDYILFSSSYDACGFKLNIDSLLVFFKKSLTNLDIPIQHYDDGINQKKGVFNQQPNEFLIHLEAPKFNHTCQLYRPNLEYVFIDEFRILEIASSNPRNTVLIPILVLEVSVVCNERLFLNRGPDWHSDPITYYCDAGIIQAGVNIHLGIFIARNSEILYFNSIHFGSRALMDRWKPTQDAWDIALSKLMSNYKENLQ